MNIKNATQVFIGQNKQKDLISLGINSYRSCFNQSNVEKTNWAVDYFNSALVNLMIQSNRKQMARGMIENMNEPYFKFKAVLELSESENKVFDSKYMERLEKYISKKMKSGQSVSNLMLTIKAIQLSDMTITSNIASDAVKKYNTFGIDKCNHIYARGLFNLTTEYQFLLATLDKSRGDFSKNHELMFLIAKITNAEEKGLNICKENGFYDYYMTAVIYGQLLIDNGVVLANNFKDKAIKKYLSTEQQVELTIATLVNSLDDLKKVVAYASKDNQDYKPAYNAIFSSPMARFHIFKSYVDYGEACEASKILFQEIKSNNDKSTYEKAINYMISSSSIDSSLKYKCGDEDLELLLN